MGDRWVLGLKKRPQSVSTLGKSDYLRERTKNDCPWGGVIRWREYFHSKSAGEVEKKEGG